MTTFELQKLRDLPIEGVAERLGLQVCRHKCLCPFHDDHTPSLSFKNNKFRCWSCGAHGGTIDLALKLLPLGGGEEGGHFVEACRWLSEGSALSTQIIQNTQNTQNTQSRLFDAARYARYFEHPFLNAEARHFLFDERKLDERVVRWCRLNSFRDKEGIPWLQIPYYDQQGKLVGIQNRNLSSPPNGGVRGGPRFRFPRGSQCGIYNLPVLSLLKPGEDLYIAEGCSDCWSLLSAGHKAIAIPSATLLTKPVVELLSGLNSSPYGEAGRGLFHMFPDNDVPGERLFLQLKEVLPGLVHHQLPPDCKDVSDLYLKGQIQNSKLINSKL